MSSFREGSPLYLVAPLVTPNGVEARDVSFDPIPPAVVSTNVQDAIEELAATTFSPMQPTILGLAYGRQSIGDAYSGYGYDSLASAGVGSLSVFNRNLGNDPQLAPLSFTCIVQNNSQDDLDTDLRAATLMINDSRIKAAKMLDCTGIISRIEANTVDLRGACVVGDMRNMNVAQAVSTIILKSTYDNPEEITLNTDTVGCVYIGNQRTALTINDGEFVAGEYDRFYLRFLNSGSTLYTVFYDPATGELTWNTTSTTVPSKRSLTEGISYGYSNSPARTEICGQGTLDQHEAAAPATMTNVTSVGFQNLAGLNAAIPVSDSMIIGSSLVGNSLGSFRQTFIASNQANLTNITSASSGNIMILPRANAISTGGVTAMINLIALSTSTLTFPTGANARNKGIVISNGPVAMGNWGNLVMCSSTGGVSFQQLNNSTTGGNSLFVAGINTFNYDLPAVRTGCVIFQNNDNNIFYPTKDNQFVCNATSYRLGFGLVGGFTPISTSVLTYQHLMYNYNINEMVPLRYTGNQAIPAECFGARHWTATEPVIEITPGVLSTATFNVPAVAVISDVTLLSSHIQLTVQVRAPTNATNTKFYTAQVQNINTVARTITANVYETDTTTNLSKNATGTLVVSCQMSV